MLVCTATAVAVVLLGVSVAGADAPNLPPGVTLPPKPSDKLTTTTIHIIGVPADSATTTTAPAVTTTTAPAAVTEILPAAAPQTRILPAPDPKAGGAGGTSTTTTMTTAATGGAATAPVASLTPGQVDDVLQNLQRSGANSTAALLDALKALQGLGMTAQEAAAAGMGQFPVQGLANWTDDWLAPRDGPPPHQHQGNDLFTQFGTPVRAPAAGTVRYETGGLGGLAAYVTTADGTYYYMAHLDGFAPDLTDGAAVAQGRIVGFAGDSGNAKGGPPHVHFEIHPGGGPAVNPKAIIDGWVAAALAQVPALIASFAPKAADGSAADAANAGDGGVPQILVATGLTRRFSAPPPRAPVRDRGPENYDRAVLTPLTPTALAPILDLAQADT